MSRKGNQESLEVIDTETIIGKHVYGNLYGCDKKLLSNVNLLKRLIIEATEIAKMTLIEVKSWKFGGEKGGVSVIALVVESHIAIHTWPHYEYATVDVFTCGEKSDPDKSFEYICSVLAPKKVIKHYADRSAI
ncbi:MAG: adenosylmethionine decarboxylase, partial [Candidatus Micrarchaeota archaeon]|nr:adenosylmethionine decarboxylase [Candidatus Micrarchaeota archaeon]